MSTESDSPEVEVPEKLSVRLDPETRQQIRSVMRESGMTCSQAVRMMLALGAEREGKLDAAFKAAAYREGVMFSVGKIRASFETAVRKALGDLDGMFIK